jgi:hypothetical protein
MQRASVERGIGCTAVFPAAFIGFAGLTDGIGPRGWRGFSELFGWAAICVAVGFLIAFLIAHVRQSGTKRYAAIPIAIAAVGAFTFLPYWVGLDAPMTAKIAFTTLLQVVGTLIAGALVVWIASIIWRDRHRY